jgi:hypothetical protein
MSRFTPSLDSLFRSRQSKWHLSEILDILKSILKGLLKLQTKFSLAHANLKPSNVMVVWGKRNNSSHFYQLNQNPSNSYQIPSNKNP